MSDMRTVSDEMRFRRCAGTSGDADHPKNEFPHADSTFPAPAGMNHASISTNRALEHYHAQHTNQPEHSVKGGGHEADRLLTHEHAIILTVLDAAEREAGSIRSTGDIRADTIRKMVDFIRLFADRCHHAKEEKHLFRMMRERGFPSESGPLAVMLAEYEEGRSKVRQIDSLLPAAEGGDRNARLLSEYAELLRSHIGKEDNVLYPMAENVLAREDMDELADIFEKVEAEEIFAGVHERYHALAHELAGR